MTLRIQPEAEAPRLETACPRLGFLGLGSIGRQWMGAVAESGVARILSVFRGRPHIFNLGHGIIKETPISHVERLLSLVRGGAA